MLVYLVVVQKTNTCTYVQLRPDNHTIACKVLVIPVLFVFLPSRRASVQPKLHRFIPTLACCPLVWNWGTQAVKTTACDDQYAVRQKTVCTCPDMTVHVVIVSYGDIVGNCYGIGFSKYKFAILAEFH